MYENLHDFETLFRERSREMEKNLEDCRRLKACRIKNEIMENYNRLFVLLLAFRNIIN